MNDKTKSTLKNILLTGSIVAGSVIGINTLSATETFKYSELGSGGELRSELLNSNTNDYFALDLSCGDATKAKEGEKKAEGKTVEGKSKDAKCGEGKCGEKKTDAKAGDVKAANADDGKVKDAKCGEGKCGEKKDAEKKTEKKKDKDGGGQPTI